LSGYDLKDFADPSVGSGLVRALRAEHVARLAAYDARAARLRSAHPGDQDLPHWLMTLSYGRRASAALIARADESLPPWGSGETCE